MKYYTLAASLAQAKAHNKPYVLPEVGGLNAAFAQNLTTTVVNAGVVVDFVGIWDGANDNLEWDTNAATSAAWKAAFTAIKNATAALQ